MPLAVGRLVNWIKLGRLPADELITMRMLRQSRAVSKKIDHGVQLTGLGADTVDIPINIEVHSSLPRLTLVYGTQTMHMHLDCHHQPHSQYLLP